MTKALELLKLVEASDTLTGLQSQLRTKQALLRKVKDLADKTQLHAEINALEHSIKLAKSHEKSFKGIKPLKPAKFGGVSDDAHRYERDVHRKDKGKGKGKKK